MTYLKQHCKQFAAKNQELSELLLKAKEWKVALRFYFRVKLDKPVK